MIRQHKAIYKTAKLDKNLAVLYYIQKINLKEWICQ